MQFVDAKDYSTNELTSFQVLPAKLSLEIDAIATGYHEDSHSCSELNACFGSKQITFRSDEVYH